MQTIARSERGRSEIFRPAQGAGVGKRSIVAAGEQSERSRGKEQVSDEECAEGEAKRFLSVYTAYKENPDVTTRRMYLETLQSVLSKTDKVILDPGVTGTVPYLPLNELRRNPATPRASSNAN